MHSLLQARCTTFFREIIDKLRKAEAARSDPTRIEGASLKALFAFWEVSATLEGLAAGARHHRKAEAPVQGRVNWRADS
ncbi:hypothetical protein Q75_14875 [Bacillus coahuilensis p1.1.43]|uniref:Uncharacterized protein n=1 Tax=Bacillus coahuilensis p1.1.43 TaxID=1150625 RepID=A0A147K545_9BACI|nr:hypothetical protein Q75_14875 [Bacillus coahuilensis p1.1.43]